MQMVVVCSGENARRMRIQSNALFNVDSRKDSVANSWSLSIMKV